MKNKKTSIETFTSNEVQHYNELQNFNVENPGFEESINFPTNNIPSKEILSDADYLANSFTAKKEEKERQREEKETTNSNGESGNNGSNPGNPTGQSQTGSPQVSGGESGMAQATTASSASTAGSSVAGATGTVATVATTVAVVAVSAVVAVVGLTPTPKISLLDQRTDINSASLSLDVADLSSSVKYQLTLTGNSKNETYEVKEGLNEYYFINLIENSDYLVDITGYDSTLDSTISYYTNSFRTLSKTATIEYASISNITEYIEDTKICYLISIDGTYWNEDSTYNIVIYNEKGEQIYESAPIDSNSKEIRITDAVYGANNTFALKESKLSDTGETVSSTNGFNSSIEEVDDSIFEINSSISSITVTNNKTTKYTYNFQINNIEGNTDLFKYRLKIKEGDDLIAESEELNYGISEGNLTIDSYSLNYTYILDIYYINYDETHSLFKEVQYTGIPKFNITYNDPDVLVAFNKVTNNKAYFVINSNMKDTRLTYEASLEGTNYKKVIALEKDYYLYEFSDLVANTSYTFKVTGFDAILKETKEYYTLTITTLSDDKVSPIISSFSGYVKDKDIYYELKTNNYSWAASSRYTFSIENNDKVLYESADLSKDTLTYAYRDIKDLPDTYSLFINEYAYDQNGIKISCKYAQNTTINKLDSNVTKINSSITSVGIKNNKTSTYKHTFKIKNVDGNKEYYKYKIKITDGTTVIKETDFIDYGTESFVIDLDKYSYSYDYELDTYYINYDKKVELLKVAAFDDIPDFEITYNTPTIVENVIRPTSTTLQTIFTSTIPITHFSYYVKLTGTDYSETQVLKSGEQTYTFNNLTANSTYKLTISGVNLSFDENYTYYSKDITTLTTDSTPTLTSVNGYVNNKKLVYAIEIDDSNWISTSTYTFVVKSPTATIYESTALTKGTKKYIFDNSAFVDDSTYTYSIREVIYKNSSGKVVLEDSYEFGGTATALDASIASVDKSISAINVTLTSTKTTFAVTTTEETATSENYKFKVRIMNGETKVLESDYQTFNNTSATFDSTTSIYDAAYTYYLDVYYLNYDSTYGLLKSNLYTGSISGDVTSPEI